MTFEKCWEVLPLPVQMLQYDVSKERHLPWAVEHIFAWGAGKAQHNVPVNVFHRAHLEMAAVYEAVVRTVVDCFCFSTFSTRTATSLCTNYLYNVSPARLYAFLGGWLVGLCLIWWKIAFEASQHTSWIVISEIFIKILEWQREMRNYSWTKSEWEWTETQRMFQSNNWTALKTFSSV